MRSSLRGAIGLAAVGLLALTATPSLAQRKDAAERQLLGIRLWRTWREVLTKHGQPNRIEVGAVTSTTGGGGGGGMMGGPMGSGGPMVGAMGSGGPMGGPYGGAMMPGGMGGSGGPYGGGGGRGRSGGMGLPGVGSMGPYGGGMGGGDLPPGGGGGMMPPGVGGPSGGGAGFAGGGGSTETSDGEITWVYEKGKITNYFLFNKDGRVIQIQSFGYSGGSAVTERGVRLGDPVGKIYATYGWTGQMSKDAANNTMTLDYSKDHHCAFQLADIKNGKGYRVVGITVAITEKNDLGGSMQGMGMGGGMMGGGMMGSPMGSGGPGMMRGGPGLPGGRGGGGLGLPGRRGGGEE
jgi:hypothetical protein